MHYYPFNISDYNSHTSHLEPLEDLAYRRMLDWCYLHEKPLPQDVKEIARLIRMRTECDCIAGVLREFFDLNPDGEYENNRVSLELDKVYTKSTKARESAQARWAKDKRDANALRTGCDGNATQDTRHTTQDTRQKKQRASPFVPPSLEEVTAYVATRTVKINPQSFIDHYETNGWMRGKTKIKDWKACVRTWETNNRGNGNGTHQIDSRSRAQKVSDRLDELGREAIKRDGMPT